MGGGVLDGLGEGRRGVDPKVVLMLGQAQVREDRWR